MAPSSVSTFGIVAAGYSWLVAGNTEALPRAKARRKDHLVEFRFIGSIKSGSRGRGLGSGATQAHCNHEKENSQAAVQATWELIRKQTKVPAGEERCGR